MPTIIGVKPIKARTYDAQRINRAIRKEKKNKGEDILDELEKTTRTWTGDKPKFSVRLKDQGNDVTVHVTLTGTQHGIDKWMWLNEGVPGRLITSSTTFGKFKQPRLAFPNRDPNTGGRGYVRKTKPGRLVSDSGGDAIDDGPFHAPEDVYWPGITAREWTKIIRDMMKKTFPGRIRVVLRKAIKGSKK